MKKAIGILNIIGLATAVLSLFAVIIAVLFQKPLVELIYGWTRQVFMLPVPILLSLLWAILFRLTLCFVCGNRSIGIWAEIVLLVINTFVYPLVTTVISTVLPLVLSQYVGMEIYMSYYNLNNLTSIIASIAGFGGTLCVVACGMSIAYKCNLKRDLKNENNLCSQSDT